MDYTALLAGLAGAVIGSLSSILTLVIQAYFQNKREARRITIETAFEDYKLRWLHANEKSPRMAPFPVILAYHKKMVELIDENRLTPENAREILRAQAEMGEALYRDYDINYADK